MFRELTGLVLHLDSWHTPRYLGILALQSSVGRGGFATSGTGLSNKNTPFILLLLQELHI